MSHAAALDPQAERRRQAPAALVLALHHLIKACQLYTDANQAVLALVQPAGAALAECCAIRELPSVRLLFADQIVFVNRRILRGSRDTTAIGLELGALLARAGISEVTLDRAVPLSSILGLARAIADTGRDPRAAARVLDGELPGIAARWVEPTEDDLLPEVEKSTVARVVRNYAASVLLLRRVFEGIERGDLSHGGRARRVAQKLVALGDDDPQLLVSLAAARFTTADPARIAVSTAVVAVAMARLVTQDPVALASLATAALLADAGRLRLGDLPFASERWAASALVVLTALGGLDPTAAARPVLAAEALRLAHGPPLPGAEPAVLARILHVARRFNEIRTPVAGTPAPGLDVAVEILSGASTDPASRTYLDLLVSGLGFFPLGTLVELTTGEVAVVVGAPRMSVDFARPPVQILADAGGGVVDKPATLDLAKPPPGAPPRTVRKALPADRKALAAMWTKMAKGRPKSGAPRA